MEAVEAVRTNRLSLCRAADLYGIGKSSINNNVIKKVNKVRLGPTPYLGEEIEQRLYRWLIKMACIGYGQSKNDLFHHIQAIVKHLKWETTFLATFSRAEAPSSTAIKSSACQYISKCTQHMVPGTVLSIWRKQETSVSLTNLFTYLMQMRRGSPWLHSQ